MKKSVLNLPVTPRVLGADALVLNGIGPVSSDVEIPRGTTAVYFFWSYYAGAGGAGLQAATLETVTPDQTFEKPTDDANNNGVGVAVWLNPLTGPNQTLEMELTNPPGEGATCLLVYVTGSNVVWRDINGLNATSQSAEITTLLKTQNDDLILKFEAKANGSAPTVSSGYRSHVSQANQNAMGSRASSTVASGPARQIENTVAYWSSILALSIPGAESFEVPVFRPAASQIKQRWLYLPRREQPPTNTPIDWSNPLTRDLMYFSPNGNSPHDLVGQLELVAGTNAVFTHHHFPDRPNMSGWVYDNSQVAGGGNGWSSNGLPTEFSNKIYGREDVEGVTTMAFIRPDVTGNYDFFFGIREDGTPWYQNALVRASTGSNMEIKRQDSAGFDQWTANGSPLTVTGDGNLHQFVVTSFANGTAMEWAMYRDGALLAATSGGTSRLFSLSHANFNPAVSIGSWDGAGTDSVEGIIACCAMWARRLREEEVKALWDNPWQIFEPIRVPIYAPAASGGPIITDVNTTESWTDGDSGLIITGSNFV